MKVAQSITVGGLENKDIAWRCERDGVTAELRHPVQYVHVNVGDVDEVDGRWRRLMHKEIRGAELVVYHEWRPGGEGTPPSGPVTPVAPAARVKPVVKKAATRKAATKKAVTRKATRSRPKARPAKPAKKAKLPGSAKRAKSAERRGAARRRTRPARRSRRSGRR
jgi:hypothetical protein